MKVLVEIMTDELNSDKIVQIVKEAIKHACLSGEIGTVTRYDVRDYTLEALTLNSQAHRHTPGCGHFNSEYEL